MHSPATWESSTSTWSSWSTASGHLLTTENKQRLKLKINLKIWPSCQIGLQHHQHLQPLLAKVTQLFNLIIYLSTKDSFFSFAAFPMCSIKLELVVSLFVFQFLVRFFLKYFDRFVKFHISSQPPTSGINLLFLHLWMDFKMVNCFRILFSTAFG